MALPDEVQHELQETRNRRRINALLSSRAELMSQLRRSVHTSRSRGINREIDRIDREIAKLEG